MKQKCLKGYSSVAVDYLSKPIVNHILLSKINVFLDLFNQKQNVIRNAALLKESADELKKVNSALNKSEGRLRDIMFSMADWVREMDKKGVYTYSSKRGPELLGVSHEQIIGKTPFDFMSPDEVRKAEDIFSEIMANKVYSFNVNSSKYQDLYKLFFCARGYFSDLQ